MQVALSVWNGRISPVFDVARQLLVLEISDGRIVSRREEALSGSEASQQARRLAEVKTDVLICGAISQPLLALLTSTGIRIVSFVAGGTEEVVTAYLRGGLPSAALSMPGCCGQHGVCGGGRLRHRGGRCGRGNPTDGRKTSHGEMRRST